MSAEKRHKPTDAELAAERAAHPVKRFTAADMPEWGPWLVERCQAAWPQFRPALWPGKLNGLAAANDHLFVHNERAVILCTAAPRVMDGRLVVLEVFAWSRDAVFNKYQERPMIVDKSLAEERWLILLYRHARDWAKSMGAARLFIGQCSDMMTPRLRELLGADACNWVSVRL